MSGGKDVFLVFGFLNQKLKSSDFCFLMIFWYYFWYKFISLF